MSYTDNKTISSGANEMTSNNPNSKNDNPQHSLKEEAELEIEIETESDCNVPIHNEINQDSNKPTIDNTHQSMQQLPQLPPQLIDHNYPPNHDLHRSKYTYTWHGHEYEYEYEYGVTIKMTMTITMSINALQLLKSNKQQFADIQHQNITEHQDFIPNHLYYLIMSNSTTPHSSTSDVSPNKSIL